VADEPQAEPAPARPARTTHAGSPRAATTLTQGENKKSFVLDNGKKIQSIFGREVEYLKSKGYTFKPDGTAVKGE